MRKHLRPAGLVVALGLLATLSPAAASAKKKPACKPPKFKVGAFCVSAVTKNSKGSVAINHGRNGLFAVVRLEGPFIASCADGSKATFPALFNSGISAPIHGSSFYVSTTLPSGSLTQFNGHWTSNSSVVVSYTRRQLDPVSAQTQCTVTVSNLTV